MTTAAIAGLSSTGHVSAADDVWAAADFSAAGLDGVIATRLAVTVSDVVYDPTRDVLYASVAETDPTYPNQIITVDPDTNQIVASRSIGTKPAALAIDAPGTALYVGVDGRGSVEKYSLPGWTKQWAYTFTTYLNRLSVTDPTTPCRTMRSSPLAHTSASTTAARPRTSSSTCSGLHLRMAPRVPIDAARGADVCARGEPQDCVRWARRGVL